MAKVKMTDGSDEPVEEAEEEEPTPEEEEVAEVAPEAETEDEEESFQEEGIPLESLDPEEELWDNGPTVGQAIEWKQKYGKLFVTSIDYDEHIMWRPIMRSEYKQHVRSLERMVNTGELSEVESTLINDELLAQTCMLWPEYDQNSETLAGIPATIARSIMQASGFEVIDSRKL